MKVYLRAGLEGRYYAGFDQWVAERERALNLHTIKRAREQGARTGDRSMVIVISSGDPSSDWFMPVPFPREAIAATVLDTGQAPLKNAA
jgi:hypothetical protein